MSPPGPNFPCSPRYIPHVGNPRVGSRRHHICGYSSRKVGAARVGAALNPGAPLVCPKTCGTSLPTWRMYPWRPAVLPKNLRVPLPPGRDVPLPGVIPHVGNPLEAGTLVAQFPAGSAASKAGATFPGVTPHVGRARSRGIVPRLPKNLRRRAPHVGKRTLCPGRGCRRSGPRIRPFRPTRRNLGMNKQSRVALPGPPFSLLRAAFPAWGRHSLLCCASFAQKPTGSLSARRDSPAAQHPAGSDAAGIGCPRG